MFNVMKILVPIDGSEASKKAAQKAIGIAKHYGSEITFVTVASMPHMYRYGDFKPNVEVNYDEMLKNTIAIETKVLDDVLDEFDLEGIIYEKRIVVGEPYEEILKIANESEYDYIIMGRRGFSKIMRFFVGSVTQRVISDSPCPVIVVKE